VAVTNVAVAGVAVDAVAAVAGVAVAVDVWRSGCGSCIYRAWNGVDWRCIGRV
jgi:hypothetical protein